MKMASSAQLRRRARLIAWLRAQPEFALLPGRTDDVTDAGRDALVVVDERMRAQRFVSRVSPLSVRIWGLRGLVTEAKTGHMPDAFF